MSSPGCRPSLDPGHPPLVSVIIPMYQAARFVGDALASVAGQDHPAIEVVAVDNDSTDGTAQVVRQAAASLRLDLTLLHQENQGPAIARNLALEHARGRLITLLDADDRMTEGRISFGVEYLRAHPEADGIIGTHVNVVDPGITPPEWLDKMPAREELPHYFVMSVLAHRDLFDRVGGFDPTYQFAGEDTEWYLRAKVAGAQLDLVDRQMLWRRIHGANLTYEVEALDRALFRLLRERARRARAATDTSVTPAIEPTAGLR